MQNCDQLFILQQQIEHLEKELELLRIQVRSIAPSHSTASSPKSTKQQKKEHIILARQRARQWATANLNTK
jgi:prefoldin subunit 5